MCQPPGRSSDLRPLNIKATTYTRRGDDEFVVGVERRIHEELHANVRMYVVVSLEVYFQFRLADV